MKKKVKATLIFAIFLASTTVVYATIMSGILQIPTSGVITDAELTSTPASIDWGSFACNTSVIRTVSLENTGNLTITDLNMTYTLPSAFKGTLTWDLEGQTIIIDQVLTAEFNLTITHAPKEPFNFNITITGDY